MVKGEYALPDPAAELATAIAEVKSRRDVNVAVIISWIGAYPAAPPVPLGLFQGITADINKGVESIHDSLIGRSGKAIQVDWPPPASGSRKIIDILAQLKQPKL